MSNNFPPNFQQQGLPNLQQQGLPNLQQQGLPNFQQHGPPNLQQQGPQNFPQQGPPNSQRPQSSSNRAYKHIQKYISQIFNTVHNETNSRDQITLTPDLEKEIQNNEMTFFRHLLLTCSQLSNGDCIDENQVERAIALISSKHHFIDETQQVMESSPDNSTLKHQNRLAFAQLAKEKISMENN